MNRGKEMWTHAKNLRELRQQLQKNVIARLLFVCKCRRPRAYCYANETDSLKKERILMEEGTKKE